MTLSSYSSRLARKKIVRCGSMLGTRKAVRRCIWLWTRARKGQSNCCRETASIRIRPTRMDRLLCMSFAEKMRRRYKDFEDDLTVHAAAELGFVPQRRTRDRIAAGKRRDPNIADAKNIQ
ncbi:unnamed protein product [Trichogramma brassicae]|uniref:Uncharacterized protein n=1 Tax=Trichogramma brassicae TaxID=86971 RepID=A0A6H5IRV6_9HYME|nr:unnamed protein product [Trichogramma brassicae]